MEEKLKHLKKSMDRTVFQGDVFTENDKHKIRERLAKERQRPWFRLSEWFSRSFMPVASVVACLLLLVVGTFYAMSEGGRFSSSSRGGSANSSSSSADMAESSSSSDAGSAEEKATMERKTQGEDAGLQGNSKEGKTTDKIVIHNSVLKKIDKEFNTDLPFDQREQYVDKRVGDPSWGARYKNGVTISDDGIVAARAISMEGDGGYTHELLPFQERPLVRGLIGDVAGGSILIMKENFIASDGTRLTLDKIAVAKKKAGDLSGQILQAYHEKLKNYAIVKIRRIQEAQQYTGKYSPTLETYLNETMNLLGQVKKEGSLRENYLAYLEGLKRLYLVNLVLSASEHVKFSVQPGSQTNIQQPDQGKEKLTGDIRQQFEKLPADVQEYIKNRYLVEHYIKDTGFRKRLKLADQMIPNFNGNDVEALVQDTVTMIRPQFLRKDKKIIITGGKRYKKVYEHVYRDGIDETEQKILNGLEEIGNSFYLKQDGSVVHPKKLGDIGRAKMWSTGANAEELKVVSDQIMAHADNKLKVINRILPLTEDYPELNSLLNGTKSYYQSVLDQGAITTGSQYGSYYSIARELFIFDDALNQPVPVKFVESAPPLSNRERVERLAK